MARSLLNCKIIPALAATTGGSTGSFIGNIVVALELLYRIVERKSTFFPVRKLAFSINFRDDSIFTFRTTTSVLVTVHLLQYLCICAYLGHIEMKILTKEEEQDHYNAVLKGGAVGGFLGLAAGAGGVWAASKRYPVVKSLTLPFRVFLAVSAGTFASVIAGDRASRDYEIARNPERREFAQRQQTLEHEYESGKSTIQRARDWANEHRYGIVFGSWLASMGAAGYIVSRNRYLSASQKLVQARVYAQGLTIAVLLASFAIEANDATQGRGRWETIKVLDPDDPEHKRMIEKKIHHERYAGEDQWKEMIEAEERKMKERDAQKKEYEKAMGKGKGASDGR